MPTKMKKHFRTLALLGIVMALSLSSLACWSSSRSATPTPNMPVVITVVVPATQSAPVNYQNSSDDEGVLVELYQRANPSVVNLTVYFMQDNVVTPLSQGSGFVYDAAGYIVTNAHVVHGAKQIDVIFSDGRTRPGELVGEDLHSDLAAVRVEDMPSGVGALPLGSMDELAVGQSVVAIGNPFGYEGTLTRGIISALGRTIPALTVFSIPQSIQTDAAINPGNSGGPLLNMNGEVIGVNAQIETGSFSASNSGVGFAIPVSIISRVVPVLIQDGKYEWPWLGVRGHSVDYSLAKAMELPVETGAYLWEVVEEGPADKAGLRGASQTITVDGREEDIGGDIITAINGVPVSSFDDLLVYVALETRPGQEVTLTILRDGKYQETVLKLAPRPEE